MTLKIVRCCISVCIYCCILILIGCKQQEPQESVTHLPAYQDQFTIDPKSEVSKTPDDNTMNSSPLLAESWREAYTRFLRSFETYNYIEREYIIPSNYDVLPVFSLYDINNDGSLELILIHDDGKWENIVCDVYFEEEGSVYKLGELKFDIFGTLGIPNKYATGIFSDKSYKGHYGTQYYYIIENKKLVEYIVREYDDGSDNNVEPYSTIYKYHDDGSITTVSVYDAYYDEGYTEYDEAFTEISFIEMDFYKIIDENVSLIILSR